MSQIAADLAKYFKFDEINIDNWHFKFYYKGCVILFFAGSMVGALSNYFGNPIQCDFKGGIDGDLAKDYCWLHGSSFIDEKFQKHMGCITDLEKVQSEDDAPDTSYYQWVTFMQLFQAVLFLLPYTLWNAMEGGLLAAFGKEGKSAVLLSEEDNCEESTSREDAVKKYVKYYKSVLHHNQLYFGQFVVCELLNFVLLFVNFVAIDKFLLRKFSSYGTDALNWLQLSKKEQATKVSPFCSVFPTEVSCTVPNFGAAGGEQTHNGMCILNQNIINEKIYLIIWFYMVTLMAFSGIYLIYRILTLFCKRVRSFVFYTAYSHKRKNEDRKALEFVLDQCYAGDWFLLHQLRKNINVYFFREFIKELSNELKHNPRQSRLNGPGIKRLEEVEQQETCMSINSPKPNQPLVTLEVEDGKLA